MMAKRVYRNGPNLYDDLVGAGIPLDHHESDLYVLHTPMAVSIIRQHGQLGTPFVGTDGKRWLELPFAYMPFWRTRAGKAKKATLGRGARRNPAPVYQVAMFDPESMRGVQKTIAALSPTEAVHKLFDKVKPKPGHTIQVRHGNNVVGEWFVSKGARPNPGKVDDLVTEHPRYGYVYAQDKFMSGWGGAPGRSFYALAVDSPGEADVVRGNLHNRSEMTRIKFTESLIPLKHRLRSGDHLRVVGKKQAPAFYRVGGF
jgi:hypothetical protein